jgi:hypothetical protein
MTRLFALTLAVSLATISSGYGSDDDDPYPALASFTSITSKIINSAGCLVAASADFNGFNDHLGTFRSAWLNRDYSIDFYRQRRKQIFVFVIVKRFAELLTEGLFRHGNPPTCSFAITAKYDDTYGKSQEMTVATWRFDQNANEKVNWAKIDPRNFADIAVDYKITADAMSWLSDEPSLARKDDNSSSPVACQLDLLRANAIFIRATTYCAKDYMDTPAGYYALAMSRQCAQTMEEDKIKAFAKEAMLQLDAIAKRSGRAGACRWVNDVEKEVLRAVTN